MSKRLGLPQTVLSAVRETDLDQTGAAAADTCQLDNEATGHMSTARFFSEERHHRHYSKEDW